ncbi:MAG TPA: serine hydrolase domain-containing protein [Luteimonas sp.]|nr:serine hydrolase domain-containing protein [Luteimonas sp.]
MKQGGKAGRALALCAAVVLAWTGVVPAIAQENIEDRLGQLMAAHDTVGLAVVVVRDNAIVYRNSLGWKDRERRIPLDGDDLFRIASISKSFAATGILQLVEQGRLSLDADVGDLVGFPVRNPRFPDRPITLAMLLNHTSSITDGKTYGSLDLINPGAGKDWRDRYADRAPGAAYEYSNLGYNMVGTIVERVSGERFDAYVKAHVLDPLGLYGGYVPEALDAGRFAQIYRWREGEGFVRSDQAYAPLGGRLDGYAMGYDTPVFSPTGGVKISATDLARYMLMHMNLGEWNGARIISAEHAKQMQTPTVDVDADSGYGLAIRTDSTLVPGVVLTGHTGSAYGLYSSMFFDPEKKYGFVVITNGTRDMEVRTEVNRALYEYFIARAADAPAAEQASPLAPMARSSGTR